MRHFHEPAGSNDTNDPARWDRASYERHSCEDLEPIDLEPNGYREAAVFHLKIMFAVDEFVTGAEDIRLAVVAVAVVLGWPPARNLSVDNIAGQLGCTPAALTRSIARSRRWPGSGAVFNSSATVPDQMATSRRRFGRRAIEIGSKCCGQLPKRPNSFDDASLHRVS
jgi:hypothetical protein